MRETVLKPDWQAIKTYVPLTIFQRMCLIRYFELEVKKACDAGHIKTVVYLSVGQESIASAISMVAKNFYILAQHRAHSVYLAFGGDPIKLIDELLGLPSGCTGGIGGSPAIQAPEVKMIGHHGLIGENVPLAVGVALGSGKPTICFFGDGALEEDYIFPSMGFAITHKLPVLFVCTDNNLSILTPKHVRRSWEMVGVAKAIGIRAVDIDDDPQVIMKHAQEFVQDLPAFINCRTHRHLWHAGTGMDNKPKQDRLQLVRRELIGQGFLVQVASIELDTRNYVERLWKERLQILSGK